MKRHKVSDGDIEAVVTDTELAELIEACRAVYKMERMDLYYPKPSVKIATWDRLYKALSPWGLF